MEFRTHKSNPLDLLGGLAVNYVGTRQAAGTGNLRYNPFVEADTWWKDIRFLLGVAGVAAGQLDDGMMGRVGQDVATGSLNSFVATEAMRSVFLEKQKTSPTGLTFNGAAAAPQIGADVLGAAQQQAAQHAALAGTLY